MQPNDLRSIIAAGVRQVAQDPEAPLSFHDVAPATEALVKEIAPTVIHATNNEPWYQSRVTWGALGAIVLPLLGYAGITSDVLSLNDFIVGGMTLASVVSGAFTLYGRWKARKPIGVA